MYFVMLDDYLRCSITVDVYFMFLSGREVVFQCRDEGPLRVDVKWSRGNGAEGLPFPRGTRDFDGRLEIPNIQVNIKNRGTKIYSAVMFSMIPLFDERIYWILIVIYRKSILGRIFVKLLDIQKLVLEPQDLATLRS